MSTNEYEIIINKNPIPIIYLDTCLMIELSKHERDCCKDKHKAEIGNLYNKLQSLVKNNRLICILGNQMEEMGATPNRRNARDFLYKFTNAQMLLPNEINIMQLHRGYNAFRESNRSLTLNSKDLFEDITCTTNSSIEIHVSIIPKPQAIEKIKQGKHLLVHNLNEIKSTNKNSSIYEEQLNAEFKADFNVFVHKLQHCTDSIKTYSDFWDELVDIYKCTGINILDATYEEKLKAVESYCSFLLSEYHHKLPYIYIRSVLFAKLMLRPNKVKIGDNLDITWASAYLPFVDYAVTDIAFCDLLESSGLAKQYNTKVYSVNSLSSLLNELNKLN